MHEYTAYIIYTCKYACKNILILSLNIGKLNIDYNSQSTIDMEKGINVFYIICILFQTNHNHYTSYHFTCLYLKQTFFFSRLIKQARISDT